MIYFIRAVGTIFVKVGYSAESVKARLNSVATGNHREVVIEGVTAGSYQDETHLHGLLRKRHHLREWFRLSQEEVRLLAGKAVRHPGKRPRKKFRSYQELQRAAIVKVADRFFAQYQKAEDKEERIEAAWKAFQQMRSAFDQLGPGISIYYQEAHERQLAHWTMQKKLFEAWCSGENYDERKTLPDYKLASELGKTENPVERPSTMQVSTEESPYSGKTTDEEHSEKLLSVVEGLVGEPLFDFVDDDACYER